MNELYTEGTEEQETTPRAERVNPYAKSSRIALVAKVSDLFKVDDFFSTDPNKWDELNALFVHMLIFDHQGNPLPIYQDRNITYLLALTSLQSYKYKLFIVDGYDKVAKYKVGNIFQRIVDSITAQSGFEENGIKANFDYIPCKTKADAANKVIELEHSYDQVVDLRDGNIKLTDWLQESFELIEQDIKKADADIEEMKKRQQEAEEKIKAMYGGEVPDTRGGSNDPSDDFLQ